MATIVNAAKLSLADLTRFRDVCARLEAVKLNPNAFSASETIEAVRDHLVMLGDLIERYEIDPVSTWNVLSTTGVIEVEV